MSDGMSDSRRIATAMRGTARARRSLPVEYFRCDRQHASVSRQSCASQHSFWNSNRGPRLEGHTGSSCTGCDIGASHRNGISHHDAPTTAPPVMLVSTAKPPLRLCRCGEPLPNRRRTTCGPACTAGGTIRDNYAVVPTVRVGGRGRWR